MSDFRFRPHSASDTALVETLSQLIVACRAGNPSEAELSELNALLEQSAMARQIFLELSQDTHSLRVWAAAHESRSPLHPEFAAEADASAVPTVPFPLLAADIAGEGLIEGGNGGEINCPTAQVSLKVDSSAGGSPTGGSQAGSSLASRSPVAKSRAKHSGLLGKLVDGAARCKFGWRAAAAAACVAFLVTAGIAYRLTDELRELQVRLRAEQMAHGDVVLSEARPAQYSAPSQSRIARLVSITNCRWDSLHSTADVESGIVTPGQSLNLMEGVAEVSSTLSSGGIGRFQLEGPLAMMLTSQGMPSLQYGKLAAQVSCDGDHFTFETPIGRAIISNEASIGLIVTVNDVEIHMFDGEAVFEPLGAISAETELIDFRVGSGKSLRISASESGEPIVHRGVANESRFVTHVSMASSRLPIGRQYVDSIRRAQPIAYWRFQNGDGQSVRNEMGSHLACRVCGEGVHWRAYSANCSAEFGAGGQLGYLITDDTLGDRVSGDYSLEAWIKPSHCHHGAFFALSDGPPTPTEPGRSGLLFELGGPSEYWFARDPGRVRFLHRNPPAYAGGSSCYSASNYLLRAWQHVVGLKRNKTMMLYLDGVLVGSQSNVTKLASGLRVVMGQLYAHDPGRTSGVRPFCGELDEVALYDRALSEAEIRKHFELVRPAAPAAPAADGLPDS